MRRLTAMPSLRAVIAEELEPGPAAGDDAALTAYIRDTGVTVFHPSGTCRMGPDSREDVVDPALRVTCLGGLR